MLTTIKYFRSEYEAHIKEKRCPAGVCRSLTSFAIDKETCIGCDLCAKGCPVGAISGGKKEPHEINPSICIACGSCREACRFDAVKTLGKGAAEV